jgi:hypothetical protein
LGAPLIIFALAFGTFLARSAYLLYLFFLPILWISLRRGLRGAATESEPGKGSTFQFTLQVAVQEAHTPFCVPLASEQLRGMRALIVDDNSTNREVLREMLCRLGMKPTCVECGKAALEGLSSSVRSGQCF